MSSLPSELTYSALGRAEACAGRKEAASKSRPPGSTRARAGRKEVASETADLLFHLLVGLRAKGVSLDMVADALAERRGVSGLAEKAARTQKD